MKPKTHALGVLFTVVLAFSVHAGEAIIDVKFSSSKATFIKGEPIVVTCTLSNLSSNVIAMDLGFDRVGGFLFSLDGSKQYANSIPQGGLSSPPDVRIKPGETYHSRMILNEWGLPLRNGSNSITACLDYNGIN
jgi:hypothetical protein